MLRFDGGVSLLSTQVAIGDSVVLLVNNEPVTVALTNHEQFVVAKEGGLPLVAAIISSGNTLEENQFAVLQRVREAESSPASIKGEMGLFIGFLSPLNPDSTHLTLTMSWSSTTTTIHVAVEGSAAGRPRLNHTTIPINLHQQMPLSFTAWGTIMTIFQLAGTTALTTTTSCLERSLAKKPRDDRKLTVCSTCLPVF